MKMRLAKFYYGELQNLLNDFVKKHGGFMGGSGSGSWYRWNTKSTAESQKRINIFWLKKNKSLNPGSSGSLSWSCRGEQSGSIGYRMKENSMVLIYKHRQRDGEWEEVEQIIPFDWTSCHFGGKRIWFKCPFCKRRVAIIYGTGKYFACRKCNNLTYQSCNEPDFQRMLDKAYKLKEKLGGEAGLETLMPSKPKGMHKKTYQKLLEEIERLEWAGEIGMLRRFGS